MYKVIVKSFFNLKKLPSYSKQNDSFPSVNYYIYCSKALSIPRLARTSAWQSAYTQPLGHSFALPTDLVPIAALKILLLLLFEAMNAAKTVHSPGLALAITYL
jgi:hypothetical protein